MKQNLDSHKDISPGLKSQFPPPSNSKLNGHSNGNGKAQHTSGGYFYAPDKIFELGLKPYHTLVFLYLCRRSDKAGVSFPSQPTIASDLRISQSTVTRAIRELKRQKLIQVETIIGKEFQQNKYQILLKSRGGLSSHRRQPFVSHRRTKEYIKEKDYISTCSSSNNVDTGDKNLKPLKDINNEHGNNGNNSLKENTKTTTHTPKEKPDEFYMRKYRAMTDHKRWRLDLEADNFAPPGLCVKWTGEETEELNALRVLAFKKQWKNDNRNVIQAPREIISERG